MESVWLCVQECVSASQASLSMTVASRSTVEPPSTIWSSSAYAGGGLLALPCTVISSTIQLLPFSNTLPPDAVTMAV